MKTRLTKSEFAVMEVLWDEGGGVDFSRDHSKVERERMERQLYTSDYKLSALKKICNSSRQKKQQKIMPELLYP